MLVVSKVFYPKFDFFQYFRFYHPVLQVESRVTAGGGGEGGEEVEGLSK